MSTGNLVAVAALVMMLMCGPGGTLAARLQQSPPPPEFDQDDPLPPPPPDALQSPLPPVHHRMRPNTSSPLHPPSHPPPARLRRSPPPPPSSPPPPPPDEEKLRSRRLLAESCADAPAVVTPLVPYGGGYVPVGAPYNGDPGVPSPAPSPASGSHDGPAVAPLSGGDGNSTLAHTTMVSAMKFNQCTYTIITCTGNIDGASTQADVNVEFFDKAGDSVLFVNLRNQNRGNFNRGATDTFTVVGDCVHNICRMHLSHDDSGPSPGWFVNTVTVSLLYQTHVFNVFEWLSKDEPPYSLSRTISSCPA